MKLSWTTSRWSLSASFIAIAALMTGVAIGARAQRGGRPRPTATATPTPPAQSGTPANETPQTVLGPGLYVYQTRTRTASCGDDERTGYVSSFVAPIHGVPGSRVMRMKLLNSPYWSSWSITVTEDEEVVGEAFLDGSTGPARPAAHFAVRRTRDRVTRFTGEGSRTYDATVDGQQRRCVVTFDALLRRLDE